MSIQQLRYVSEAVERCSYAEAARKLIVSPQTVSKAAASMEKRYGIQLFESDGRGVKPTLLGRKFAEDAKLVVRTYDELNNKYGNSTTFREESTPVTIAIAKSSLRGEACSERLLNDIQQRFSGNVRILRFQSDTCLRAVEDYLADACLIVGSCAQQNYLCEVLGRIRLEALVFESHPENICDQLATGNLESRKIALPEDIRYVLPELKKHFDTHGLPVPQMEQIGSSESDAIEFLREGGVIISAPNCSLEKSNRQIVRTNFLEHCPLYQAFLILLGTHEARRGVSEIGLRREFFSSMRNLKASLTPLSTIRFPHPSSEKTDDTKQKRNRASFSRLQRRCVWPRL